jgi:hypothetical protein
MTRAEKIISTLGYAGLVPFIVASALVYVGAEALADQIFLSYSAIILSFLGGTHWGRLIASDVSLKVSAGLLALIASNVFALLGWSALLLSHYGSVYPFVILTTGFVMLFVVEVAAMPSIDSAVHRRYTAFRAFLTITVLLLHGVFLFLGA